MSPLKPSRKISCIKDLIILPRSDINTCMSFYTERKEKNSKVLCHTLYAKMERVAEEFFGRKGKGNNQVNQTDLD